MGIQSTGNVFFDLGFSPAESQTLLIKSPLMHMLDFAFALLPFFLLQGP